MSFLIEKTNYLDWTALPFTLYLSSSLSDEQKGKLRHLIFAWYDIGACGGFDGVLHFISELGFEEEPYQSIVEWWVDMGSAKVLALDVLLKCLAKFAELEQIKIDKLCLGYRKIS